MLKINMLPEKENSITGRIEAMCMSLAHLMIDDGADVIIGHGPHVAESD